MSDRMTPPPLPQLNTDDDFNVEETQLSRDTQRLLGLGKRDYPSLIIVAGANVGEVHHLEDSEIIVGRGEKAHVRLHDDKISRQHARIYRTDDGIIIEDMSSANGTFVNSEKVSNHILKDGDKIGFGSRTILRFTYHDKLDESFQRGMYERTLRDGLYRALFASSPMPTFLVEAKTLAILAVNAAGLKTYGYTDAELRAMTFSELECDPPSKPAESALLTNQRRSTQHRTKGHHVLDVEVVTQELQLDGRSTWLSIVDDVTERKRMEARLRVSDRMASVGTLAAGVAHEINNPLTYVISNLSFIADALRTAEVGTPELRDVLGEAQEGAERIRVIVRDLKSFSKPEDLEAGPVDVHQMLNASINMAFNEIRHRARLVKDYAPSPPIAHGNEARLGQVFLNLLVNAAQAIPEGDAERNEIRISTREMDTGYAVVEVRDSGAGIPEELHGRLFDPFFTTKVGAGTGLGLSICHNIVAAHGGRLEVESAPGAGTIFRVLLPLGGSKHVPAGPRPPRLSTIPPGLRRGRILVVDDDAKVAAALRRHLAKEHDVTVIARGADVLASIQGGTKFDVILCDLMMPEMTGMELHGRLVEAAPDQAERMIFVTGGAFTPNAQTFLEEVPNERVDKPFDPNAIRAVVRRIIRLSG
jgi:PAS domain S-box-containing protein